MCLVEEQLYLPKTSVEMGEGDICRFRILKKVNSKHHEMESQVRILKNTSMMG